MITTHMTLAPGVRVTKIQDVVKQTLTFTLESQKGETWIVKGTVTETYYII